jgi:hypothetical protein
MPVLSLELAQQEVEEWMNVKKVRTSVREANKENIQVLADGFMDGLLALNKETNEITQELMHPTDGVKKLVFKSRLTAGDKSKYLSRAKSDINSQIVALLAALSGENSALIAGLDTDDIAVSRSLTSFFF